ncbi:MAG: sugar ABC transporter permease [Chloroflexota bacterium]|nr:MAG: sugar ABC transporter permease [Chloroflexota bacterium]
MQQAKPQAIGARTARRARWLNRDRIAALLMIAPSVIAVAIFVYGFIGWTAFISLTNWEGLRANLTFVGLENYATIFNTGRFQTNIRNLVVFTTLFLAICLVIGLLLAVLVDSRIRAESLFRSIYIFPMALSFIVTGVVWQWIFAPGNWPNDPTGINLLFKQMGLDFLQGAWTTDTSVVPGWRPEGLKTRIGIPMAMIPVIIAAVWQMSGFVMAMYLAGLRGIPDEIKEAARVDGASEWQVFRRVTLPLLQPVTLSAVIVLGHISLKIFDLIVTMTGGAPGNNTEVPGLYMYEITFKANKFSEGAAVAIVMLVVVAALVIPYLNYNRRTEVEQ